MEYSNDNVIRMIGKHLGIGGWGISCFCKIIFNVERSHLHHQVGELHPISMN